MDDYPLTFEQLSAPRIALMGSRTLQRYTNDLLAKGFTELGWDIVPYTDTENHLYQIHAAPHAIEDDQNILFQLQKESGKAKCIVLIHRPDEAKLLHRELTSILSRIPGRKSLALLGDLFVEDPFYTSIGCDIEVVPHGFYSARPPKGSSKKIVVGTHTTWGEMRMVHHAAEIVARVLALSDPGSVVGYLGGVPHVELRESKIAAVIASLDLDAEIEIAPSLGQVQSADSKRVLVINPGSLEPDTMQATFNTQLYMLGDAVRFGESSGSLHTRACIPVIYEANGIERAEGLKAIRIPFETVGGELRFDMQKAAREIAGSIADGTYVISLRHNAECAKQFSPKYVAKRYSQLFEVM